MTADPAHLEHARKVADAVLYEGYLLYPYRRSSQKNRTRFQFGVLMPPPYRAIDDCEPSASQTECLVECRDDARVAIGLRFLHLQHRTAQRIDPATGEASDVDAVLVDGTEYGSFDEAVEREQHLLAGSPTCSMRIRNCVSTSPRRRRPRNSPARAGRRRPAGPPLRAAERCPRGPGRAPPGPYGVLRLRCEWRTAPSPVSRCAAGMTA